MRHFRMSHFFFTHFLIKPIDFYLKFRYIYIVNKKTKEDKTMKAMEYRVFRNGEPQNSVTEPYCGEFRSAFSHMFPNFKTISATENHVEAHCVMDGNYFEIVANDTNI